MRKLIVLIILSTVFGCKKEEVVSDILPVCEPTLVTFFEDGAYSNYVFGKNSNDANVLKTATIYEGTDSSYIYTYNYDTKLQSITQTEDGESVTFTAFYENNRLSKFVTDEILDLGKGELIFNYSSSRVSKIDLRVYATDGNPYQIGELRMTYDTSGDLIKSEQFIDIVAVFTIVFGPPIQPYSPALFGSITYEYGPDQAPNPLYGVYVTENPDLTFMNNLPVSMVVKDENGTVTDSESYTITLNDKGYPVKSVYGDSYIEVTYDCE